MVFKIKNMKTGGDGARCDQASHINILKTLNALIPNLFDNQREIEEQQKVIKLLWPKTMCFVEEFIMRYLNDTDKDNKNWFLDPVAAIIKKDLDKRLKK